MILPWRWAALTLKSPPYAARPRSIRSASSLYSWVSGALRSARRYDEALAAYQDGLSLQPKNPKWADGPLIYYALGDFEKMRAVCEGVGEAVRDFQDCLALAYNKLGRQADAETALARFKALEGNAGAYDYATIYAQSGDEQKHSASLKRPCNCVIHS